MSLDLICNLIHTCERCGKQNFSCFPSTDIPIKGSPKNCIKVQIFDQPSIKSKLQPSAHAQEWNLLQSFPRDIGNRLHSCELIYCYWYTRCIIARKSSLPPQWTFFSRTRHNVNLVQRRDTPTAKPKTQERQECNQAWARLIQFFTDTEKVQHSWLSDATHPSVVQWMTLFRKEKDCTCKKHNVYAFPNTVVLS